MCTSVTKETQKRGHGARYGIYRSLLSSRRSREYVYHHGKEQDSLSERDILGIRKREPVRNIREIFEDVRLRDALIRQIYSSRENSHWKISSTEEEIKGEILGWLSRAYMSDSASFPPDFDF